jgi:hypothetical protein
LITNRLGGKVDTLCHLCTLNIQAVFAYISKEKYTKVTKLSNLR